MFENIFNSHGDHVSTAHWIFMVIIWLAVFFVVWMLIVYFLESRNKNLITHSQANTTDEHSRGQHGT